MSYVTTKYDLSYATIAKMFPADNSNYLKKQTKPIETHTHTL